MAEERVQRRLAAILVADVVGYSRLMGADEEGTLARLKLLRQKLLEPTIAAYRGRIFKLMGDGALAEFASAVDAVRCAVEIQRAAVEAEGAVPEARRISFRVGINVGDIVVDDDDIYGDCVNIAARIEGLAEPNGICVSDDVYRQVRGKVVDVRFEDRGAQTVKNIAEPVHAYSVVLAVAPPAAKPPGADRLGPSAARAKPSMAFRFRL